MHSASLKNLFQLVPVLSNVDVLVCQESDVSDVHSGKPRRGDSRIALVKVGGIYEQCRHVDWWMNHYGPNDEN